MNEHKGFKVGEPNENGKDCWGCGYWLIGGGCWKNSNFSMNQAEGWRNTNPDDSCEEWVPEDTEAKSSDQRATSGDCEDDYQASQVES